MKEDLVSILMPSYNSDLFIKDSISSVVQQSYKNWELLITEDGSKDNTESIVKSFNDPRIKYFWQKNRGAAEARNNSLKHARGRFIAFLDADDIWFENKLKKQIEFMKIKQIPFSCTSYVKINEQGESLGKIIHAEERADYKVVLARCPIGNLTVIYDTEQLGKVEAIDIQKRNDYCLWLKILKITPYVFGLDEVLAGYRVRKNSLSSNKIKLVWYHWYIYTKIEKIGYIKSVYHIIIWIIIKLLRIK